MNDQLSNITCQVPTDTKRKLEYMSAVMGEKKLLGYLRKLFRELTKDVVLPGPGEYIRCQNVIL